MNVNENGPVFNPIKNRNRQLKAVPIQRTLMGPPKRPAPKRKGCTNSAYTTSSSSHIQWRSQQKSSCHNNSGIAHTASTSRSRSSTEPESRIVLALSEGRGEAICEVGIAAINVAHPSLILCQISDSQSYINTITKINILNPSEILIPLTFIESFTSNRLIEKVREKFHDVKITGVPRSSFNKTNGLQYIKQLCIPSTNSILLVLQHRYYALAAAAALLTYTENTLFVVYASESIKIEYEESEGSTIIDVATADGLELVASARPSMEKRFSCLLDILNHCITKIGARTLRATILQPPCSVPDIEARLDCITELMEHTDMLAAIQAALIKLVNIDQLLSLATVLPDQAQNCSERQLNYILILNTTLEQITPLKTIIENSKQPFFIELRNTLSNPIFTDIKNLVRTLIHSDAWPAKGQHGVIQRCFAIKPGVNSLLDLLRKSYSERLDDMREYVKTLGEKYSLALTLNNTNKKGYHIILTLNAHQKRTLKKSDLPGEFIQVERLSTCYTMKTQDLINLSHRVEDMMLEILKMSNIMIFRLLIQIREHVGIFYKLCEDIAQLDMLQSLAKASSAIHYIRPKFSDYLEVEQARHPLLDYLCSVEPTANSVFASKEHNMNIITGPNGSGKSIFIRQIMLIQVMAQVGCYVPAHSATLRVSDRILAKVYLEDNMDCGASAFVLEMKEIQYFLNVLTDNSLIVIDELCRSTSVEEGTAIAMAVCEKLMKMSAFLFFTTHFKFMTKLEDLHYNVKTWQLETLTETVDNQMILRFTYNVIPGVISLEHYGIFLAKTSWPENIIKYAEKILKKLSKSQKTLPTSTNNVNEATRLKYNLEAEFKILKTKKQLTQILINEKLAEYNRDLENLGYQIDELFVRPLGTQENGNEVEINDIQMDNISQILNNQVEITNNAQQINGFEGFNFHSDKNPEIFGNIEEASNRSFINQPTSFNARNTNRPTTSLECSIISQDFNLDNNSINSFNLQNMTMVNNTEFRPSCNDDSSFLQDITDNGNNPSDNLYHRFSQDSHEILEVSNKIFEPEVILQTTTSKLEINFTNIQKDAPTVHQVTEQSSFTMFDVNRSTHNDSFHSIQSNLYKENSSKVNSVVSQHSNRSMREHLSVIREDSFMSQENPFLSASSSSEFCERCEDAISVFDTESILSVNENQFSLPLQHNLERTSTPLPELMQFTQNQLNSSENSRIYEDQLKSANSNSIKWGIEKTQNIISTPTSKTNEQLSSVASENIQMIVPKATPAFRKLKTDEPLHSKLENMKSMKETNFIGHVDADSSRSRRQLNSTNISTIQWGIEKFQKTNYVPSNSNEISNSKIRYSDTSSPSINNEYQFSLPLQHNLERTSTPLQIYSEPTPSLQNQTKRNFYKHINSNSNSVKWGIEKTQNILSTPTTSSVLKTNEQSTAYKNTKQVAPKLKMGELSNSDSARCDKSNKQHFNSTNTEERFKSKELTNSFQNITLISTSTNKQIDCNTSKQSVYGVNKQTNLISSYHDSSIPSVNNEYQFSLPLQQNNKKTSTPLKVNSKIHSEPISYAQKHSTEHINSEILKSKSTSTNSDSIKWITGKAISTSPVISETNQQSNSFISENIRRSTLSVTVPNITEQSNSEIEQNKNLSIHSAPEVNKHQSKLSSKNLNRINKQKDANTCNKSTKSSNSINFKGSNNSVTWGAKTKPDKNANNTYNSNHYYSTADITDIINDLQSCSEYFTDEEHWDTLDEETNLKLKQVNNKNNTFQSNMPISQSNTIEENSHTVTNQNSIHSQENNTFKSPSQRKTNTKSCEKEAKEKTKNKSFENLSLTQNKDCAVITSKNLQQSDSQQSFYSSRGDTSIQYIEQLESQNEERLVSQLINSSQAKSNKDEISHLLEDEVEFFEEINLDEYNNKATLDRYQEESSGVLQKKIHQKEQPSNKNKQDNKRNPNQDLHPQTQINVTSQIDNDKEDVHGQSMNSLTPLGDIHLELFNDESVVEEIHTKEIHNSNEFKNDSASQNQKNPEIPDQSYSDLFSDVIETSQRTNIQSLHTLKLSNQSSTEKLSKNDTSSSHDNITLSSKSKKRKQTEIYATSKSQSSNIFQVSPTSSDFEIPDEEESRSTSKKKRKWIPPFKSSSNISSCMPSNPQKAQKKQKHTMPKFKPPKKLTKKEIEDEFYKQDKKMLESGDSAQYIQQLLNRPSVKQIQAAKHIMSIHKTSSGVVVVPTKENKPEIRKRRFTAPLKCQPIDCDVTLLSDKNSDKYEEFMNSKKKEEIINVRQDMAHEYRSEVVRKNSSNSEVTVFNKSSEDSCFEKFGNAIQNFKTELLNKNDVLLSSSNMDNKKSLKKSKGYYTQNKERIDNMVNKYLSPEITSKDSFGCTNQNNSQQSSSSIFSQATVVINRN